MIQICSPRPLVVFLALAQLAEFASAKSRLPEVTDIHDIIYDMQMGEIL